MGIGCDERECLNVVTGGVWTVRHPPHWSTTALSGNGANQMPGEKRQHSVWDLCRGEGVSSAPMCIPSSAPRRRRSGRRDAAMCPRQGCAQSNLLGKTCLHTNSRDDNGVAGVGCLTEKRQGEKRGAIRGSESPMRIGALDELPILRYLLYWPVATPKVQGHRLRNARGDREQQREENLPETRVTGFDSPARRPRETRDRLRLSSREVLARHWPTTWG